MSRTLILVAALLGGLLSTAPAHAQGSPASPTRAQVVMDTESFLKMFRWDELGSQWVMREGVVMPAGIKSRAAVMAMIDDYLKMHRWDDSNSEWVPTGGKPRDMSTLTRDQVHRETLMFLMTHRFDERAGQWVSKMKTP